MKYIFKLNIVLGLLLLTACGEEKKETEKFLRPVKYQEVGYLGGEKIRSFSGTSRTDEIINLSFRSGGILTMFDIKLGQNVSKGQLLAKLDNVQSRLNYENAVSSLNSAASQMNTAKSSLERIRSLYEKGSTSLSDYEAAKNSYRTAQASHESAKRTVAIQQDQISYGFLYAPNNGTIASISTEVNENVTAGQVVAVLNVSGDMEISLGLPESVINYVKQNMEVNISFSAIADTQFKGIVTEVAPAVDVNTATYLIRVTVSNPTNSIKSGMAANVIFDFGDHKNDQSTLVVPTHAVGEDSNGRFVFVVVNEGDISKVKKQQITIGNLTAEGFEVKSGLTVGQKIATAGLQTLLDGQEVKLQ